MEEFLHRIVGYVTNGTNFTINNLEISITIENISENNLNIMNKIATKYLVYT